MQKRPDLSGLFEAGDRSRTGDLQLGKLTLYQLSYARRSCWSSLSRSAEQSSKDRSSDDQHSVYMSFVKWGGRDLNPRLLRCERSALAS